MIDAEYILFDLDGTLTDSAPGILNSVRYALEKLGQEPLPEAVLRKFLGPPLVNTFSEYAHLDSDMTEEAIRLYRVNFKKTGMFENSPYEGVAELLKGLKESGKKAIVATSKPEEFAKTILDHFGLSEYFEQICGATMDLTRNKKADVIAYALEKIGVKENNAVMVGDRDADILGAKANGLLSIGVLYGYGSKEELENAGADYTVKTPHELLKLLCE